VLVVLVVVVLGVVVLVGAEVVPPLALAGGEAGLALLLSLVGSLLSPLVAIAITATTSPTARAPKRTMTHSGLGGGGGGGGGGSGALSRANAIRRARARRRASDLLSGGVMDSGTLSPCRGACQGSSLSM
jgi:hypothetical protein